MRRYYLLNIRRSFRKKLAFVQPMINDGNLIPLLGTLTMAAIMEKEGWWVRFFDERLDADALGSAIDFRPDIVGISAVTGSVLRGHEIAIQIKAVLPDTIVVFGGPHPTAIPEEVLGWDSVDFVIVGEGEFALRDLCQWFLSGRKSSELKEIPNLCYIDGNFVQNRVRPFLQPEELDRLPMPAFHLLDLEQVFKKIRHGIFQKGHRILPIMASRGCPNHCTFCCRMMGSIIRYRSPESVLNEIEYMVRNYNLDEIYFEDDNFTANKKRAYVILDSLIERKLGIHIKFANGIRADGVDGKMLEKMKKAGCYSISFGIESGSERVLEMMKKNLSLKRAKENVKIAKSMGFLVGGNIIVGYPSETVEDIEQSLEFFMNLDLDSMAIVNLIPFPGTEVRRICENKGYLTPEAQNWNNYIFDIKAPKILVETEFLDRKTLLHLINKAYRRMYLNLKRIYNLLKHMELKDSIEGTKIMLSKFLKRPRQR